jgi:hypothetical protein
MVFTLEGCNCGALAAQDAGVDAVTTALSGLRWELPCVGVHSGDGCATGPAVRNTLTLAGSPELTYDATLRFRGVVEVVRVDGGVGSGYFRVGGALESVGYNAYSLQVAAPSAVYYLNAGQSGPRRCYAIDYVQTISLQGQSTLTLGADPRDGFEIVNTDGDGGANLVAGVAPAPLAFDGQFIQMDVVTVVPR